MKDREPAPRVGPYLLTKTLGRRGPALARLALHPASQTSHVLYLFSPVASHVDKGRFIASAQAVAALRHAHLLPVERFGVEPNNTPWIATPYTGDVHGLLPLHRLLRERGGAMSPDETDTALTHLLEAVRFAHDLGEHHGPIDPDQLLVDQKGSLHIELYSLSRKLQGLRRGDAELVRDEIRSLVEVAYLLITGLRAEEPIIPVSRLVRKLSPVWAAWFDRGLDPTAGFDDAAQALAALPSRAVSDPLPPMPVARSRTVWSRFRSVIRQ